MSRDELSQRCETIERAYEFMLAYAAQGLPGDAGNQAGGQIRDWLRRAASAMAGLGEAYQALVDTEHVEPSGPYRAFLSLLGRDAENALAVFELALAQPSISSQLVDNLNASIHVRTLLTDLFLIDEILNAARPDAEAK